MAASSYQEWLNRNAHRAFPFVENSNFSCTGGKTLPNSVVLDARFCMFDDTQDVFLDRVSIAETGKVTLWLRPVDNAGRGARFSVTSENSLVSSTEYLRSYRIVTGNPDDLIGLAGDYRLNTPALFLRSRVLSMPYGIGADTLEVPASPDTPAYGDIEVVDGHNTTLEIENNNLVLTIGSGLGKGMVCPDPNPYSTCGEVLYYINGQAPNSDGSFSIVAGEGVTVKSGHLRGIPAVYVSVSPEVTNFVKR